MSWISFCFPTGMEISEEQRKRAILNAQKAKQGKIKSKLDTQHVLMKGYVDLWNAVSHFSFLVHISGIGYSGHQVPTQYQPLHPLHQRHVTVPTSVPQQQVFALAEPKQKPTQLWYQLARNALFKK